MLRVIEEKRAKLRQATSTGGVSPQLLEKLPEAEKGNTRDIVAAKIGMSGRTAEKAAKLDDTQLVS